MFVNCVCICVPLFRPIHLSPTAYVNAYGGHATLVGGVESRDGRPHVRLQQGAEVAFDDLDVRIADNKAAFLLNIMLLVAHEHVEASIQQEVMCVRVC